MEGYALVAYVPGGLECVYMWYTLTCGEWYVWSTLLQLSPQEVDFMSRHTSAALTDFQHVTEQTGTSPAVYVLTATAGTVLVVCAVCLCRVYELVCLCVLL